MKKLAVLIMIPALAIFMVGTLASAEGVPRGAVHGTYELFATGTCMHSSAAFTLNPTTKPSDPESAYAVNTNPGTATPNANTWVSSYLGRGTFTFNGDGTGAMRVTQSCITHMGEITAALDQKVGPPTSAPPAPFAYWLGEDGTITVQIPAVGLWLTGTLSPDHKTMTLISTMQQQELRAVPGGPIVDYQICTIGRLLFRVGE